MATRRSHCFIFLGICILLLVSLTHPVTADDGRVRNPRSNYKTLYKSPHCEKNRDAIVHLMEWKWTDIAKECTDFLGPYGYCGVQVSPTSENRIVLKPNRPWWERYQPVSYKIASRSGNEIEFKDMVKTCEKAGVRIYADIIMNHMAADGGVSKKGTAGSSFNAKGLTYPGVPYGPSDFNDGSLCKSNDGLIHDWTDPKQVRNCRTLGLPDLALGKDSVRNKVIKYLNHLIDLGVSGFRLDGAKFMWPADMEIVFESLSDVDKGGRPFIYQDIREEKQEKILATEYLDNGRVTNFKYGDELKTVFRKKNPMKYLKNWGPAWNMWDGGDVVNFLDSHTSQRDSKLNVLTHRESRAYKVATAFMLAHPYGMPRIMSSYNYRTVDDGPPHNDDMSTKTVSITNHICADGWVCEHRWRQIYNMVAFRKTAYGTPVENWWSGADYQIAFSRGSRAFIALNLENYDINTKLYTGLPGGTYCDIITGNISKDRKTCEGKAVSVDGFGNAHISVCNQCDDPVLALHIGAKLGPEQTHMG